MAYIKFVSVKIQPNPVQTKSAFVISVSLKEIHTCIVDESNNFIKTADGYGIAIKEAPAE